MAPLVALDIPLSLRDIANRAFQDEVADDGRGGWTDQGPDNDLSLMRPGKLIASGITFEIIDPSKNNNRAALVFGKVDQTVPADPGEASFQTAMIPHGKLPAAATLRLSPPPASLENNYKSLYLLHAAVPARDETVVGTIIIRHTDGTQIRHDVVNGRDVANWRDPAPLPNAGIAWTADNPTASVGLYISRFPVDPSKTPVSVTFESGGICPWMIVALTASTSTNSVGIVNQTFVVKKGPEWAPYNHTLDIIPGSVFDFSFLAGKDAPAGKHGRLVATPDGHFTFEKRPASPVRFWGVNLCFSANYLARDDADLLAARLARSGYNTVRFHHYDSMLVRKGGDSWELDPEKLDQLDYLFAAMKKRGIYINIDLYSSRGFSAAESAAFGFPNEPKVQNHFKALVPINEAAFESWARFATNLLTHKNPHTGLTWAEDPALIGICPVNENPLFNRVERDPRIAALCKTAFDLWWRNNRKAGENDTAAYARFIHETNARSDARLFAHLRALDVKALLTGANYTISQGLAYVRDHYDYVDGHGYWDHPKFPVKKWAFPIAFGQRSPVAGRAWVSSRIMPIRILGKPFAVTEFSICRPNRHRAEGAVLIPSYASLQDWGAMYNFHYAMSDRMAIRGDTKNYFALASDPIGLIADRTGALLFQRGDISPATRTIAYAVRPDEAFSNLGKLFPSDFAPLGLVSRIGSLPGEPAAVRTRAPSLAAIVTGSTPAPSKPVPAKTYLADSALYSSLQRDNVIPRGSISEDARRFVSDTRQIELRSDEGTLRVVTPRSELFVLAAQGDGRRLVGDRASVVNETTGVPSVVSVISLPSPDSDASGATPPLAETRRILVLHLTDALPDGMTFAHADQRLLQSWGKGPHLVRLGNATLTLRLPAGAWKAWAVDPAGKRVAEIPIREENGRLTLALSTIAPSGTRLAYELAR
ncbi:glycosyl hydrolase family 5 [Opitutaceae bacterium TAV4]|nr:glycosyl hydrolase family 5 [Opitutaceae bacterium TAV4]RRK02669.1 glycosyl hydrolase family 5 [Opitutaceae bacterium TAV3]